MRESSPSPQRVSSFDEEAQLSSPSRVFAYDPSEYDRPDRMQYGAYRRWKVRRVTHPFLMHDKLLHHYGDIDIDIDRYLRWSSPPTRPLKRHLEEVRVDREAATGSVRRRAGSPPTASTMPSRTSARDPWTRWVGAGQLSIRLSTIALLFSSVLLFFG